MSPGAGSARGGGIGALLKGLLRRERIAGPDALQAFWQRRAAFMAQKCVIEYCRARAGLNWQRLFSEQPFQQAVHAASWRAWGLTVLDMAEMLDAVLRVDAPDHAALLGWLGRAGEALIARETAQNTLPVALGADFAEQAQDRLHTLLAELARREALPVKDIARARADEVFDIIPMHDDLKAPDRDYVFNTLRASLVRAADDLRAAADIPVLAARLR